MSGFQPRVSGVGCDHSTNFATSTALILHDLQHPIKLIKFNIAKFCYA